MGAAGVAAAARFSSDDLGASGLAAPEPISPEDGQTFSNLPRTTTLRWARVAGAQSYLVEVEFLDGSDYIAYLSELVADPEFTFDFVGAQPGRWRVTARADDLPDSAPSPWRTFSYTV